MAYAVATQLSTRGHDVTILTGSGAYTRGKTHERAISKNVRVVHLAGTNGGRAWSWVSFWFQAMFWIPFSGWDRCILLTDPPFLIAAAPLAKAVGPQRRIYWWTMDLYPEALHADGALDAKSPIYKLLQNINEFGLGSIDGVIALGERQLQRLRAHRVWKDRPDFVALVPPWDDRTMPKADPTKNQIIKRFGWEGKKVVLYAGNLGRGHTYRPALEAARLLEEQGDCNWVFAFFCRGWHREELAREAETLSNLVVNDYVSLDETSDLLHAADVHLITMEDRWEGIVVPTKLSGVLQTSAPILFIGPPDADTAQEIQKSKGGKVLTNECSGYDVIETLNALVQLEHRERVTSAVDGATKIAEFVTRRNSVRQ